ncbi:hypothetical protein IMAU30040_00802 [Lactobacillus helveticus]|nr:hypothetical protein [Lactobacillus helveticus]NRO00248.1 hypothetical protein [Lactobacillus helveticus]
MCKSNSLIRVVLFTLIVCTLILGILWKARKVPTYNFKQLEDKNTDIDKLTKMSYGYKTMQDLIGMCIIGVAVNSIQSSTFCVWFALIYGVGLYLIIAFALYDFKIKITDLKDNSKSYDLIKQFVELNATDKELKDIMKIIQDKLNK